MKKILNYCNCFCYITTGVLLVCAVNYALFNDGAMPEHTLWKILFSGFLTTIVTIFLFPWNAEKTKEIVARILLHYICLCVVMIGCGVWFDWISFGVGGVITMLLSVAGVYAFTFVLSYITEKKQAEEINRALTQRYTKHNS